MKACTRCGETKGVEEFHRARRNRDGRFHFCKACGAKASREWYQANPERRRRARLRRDYGLTIEAYEALFKSQGSRCAICGSHEPGGTGVFNVDHDHESGQVRGILCWPCNTTLGKMNDDPLLLRKAADYLEVWSHQSSVA